MKRRSNLEISEEELENYMQVIVDSFTLDWLTPKFNSYTLMILVAYHQNEHLNLYSKIEEACANLSTHSANENDKIINSLFIHLPDTISLAKCKDWLNEYFTTFPG